MKNTNSELFNSNNSNSSSISTDSLEILTKSREQGDLSSKSTIREYSSDPSIQEMKKSSNKQQKTLKTRLRIPIRKRSCTRLTARSSNCENVINTSTKVNQETNTVIPVYPEIVIKHCHNDKVVEKVIPAVDGPRIAKPKTYIEIVRHGERNGKLNILPIGKNQKSYLEIFQSRHGIRTPVTAEGNRSRVDDTPKDYGDFNLKKLIDNDSLYSKDLVEKESKIRYPSQASSIFTGSTLSANTSDSVSRSSSLMLTSSGLTSISEQMLLAKEDTSRTSKTLTPANSKKNGLKIIKSESDSTREKLQKFIRQREYGQTVSNRNRIKIIQNHIRNSDSKPAVIKEQTYSKSNTTKREETPQKTLSQIKKIMKKPDDSHGKMVDMSIGTDDLNTFKTQQNSKNTNADRKKSNTPLNVYRDTLKSLQHRHLKDQEIVEKLRNTTL